MTRFQERFFELLADINDKKTATEGFAEAFEASQHGGLRTRRLSRMSFSTRSRRLRGKAALFCYRILLKASDSSTASHPQEQYPGLANVLRSTLDWVMHPRIVR